MRRTWLGLLVIASVGCAPGARELRLRAEVDPLLMKGEVAQAIGAGERLGGLDAPRRRAAAETVIWQALRSPKTEVRLDATERVAALADPKLDPELPARLADPDGSVRAVAAAALADQSDAARAVLDRALLDPDPAARALALTGVAAASDPAAALTRLAADPDPRVREAAASALAHFTPRGGAALARRLLAALAADRDAGVRSSALTAIGARQDRGLLPVVERALDDPALAPRLGALFALARLDQGSPRLLALARPAGSSPLVRFVALRASVELHRLGLADAVSAVRAAASDPREDVREAAMNAAGELGPPGLAVAETLLHDPSLAVRMSAARALAHGGEPEKARPIFSAALATRFALDAADELAHLGDPRGLAMLESAAHASDPATRRHAISLVAPLPASVSVLTSALADRDPEVRLTAASALLRCALPKPER